MTEQPAFVAIDGESAEDRYFLLCSSSGRVARDRRGLSTVRAFDFLIREADDAGGRPLVAFGLDYDVNHWLRDLPPEALVRLAKRGETLALVRGRAFWLSWIPGKSFQVSDHYRGGSAKVMDVFGFFQSSFVDALSEWRIPDPAGAIARMKARRSDFTLAQAAEVEAYCRAECDLLAQLMGRVAGAIATAGIQRPRSWVGAGPVADALMRQHGVKEHVAAPNTEDAAAAVDAAYFGGRIELFQIGRFRGAYHVDLNSAYPWAAADLPSLAGSHWERRRAYDAGEPVAVWRCTWDVGDAQLTPFPFRDGGDVFYPQNGEGWYHAAEVAAARSVFGDAVQVHEGHVCRLASEARPFAFVRELYERRLDFAAEGDAAENVIKLGMNAIYGKVAQGVGSRGKLPPYRSLTWAGMITAAVRARMLLLAARNPEAVIAIATDGLLATHPLGEDDSRELGAWAAAEWRDLFIAGNGIYHGTTADGEEIRRARGFLSRELDYRALRAGWRRFGPAYVHRFAQRRFIGVRGALRAGTMADWRSWADVEHTLYLDPRPRKWFADAELLDAGLWNGAESVRLAPPVVREGRASDPYEPKGEGGFSTVPSDPADDYAEGREQPLRTL